MQSALNENYHCSDETYFKRAESSLFHGIEEMRITQNDRMLIEKFTLRLKSVVSSGRYMKIVSMLVTVRRYFRVEYGAATEDDYLDALSNIKYARHPDGKNKGQPFSQNTIADWTKVVKRFYLFLYQRKLTSIPFDTIKETKPERYDRHTKTEDDILTIEEINHIISVAPSFKLKAYIALLYELGARSIEIANLKWKDIEVKDGYVSCTIHDTKTNKIRVVPSVAYVSYLFTWRNQYPGNATGENFVFIDTMGKPLRYATIMEHIRTIAKHAGIKKNVTLHIFRHSRITHVLREGMNETLVKKAFWGNELTNMIDVYGHLTNKDVENEYLRISGVNVPNKSPETQSIKSITCPNCLRVNPPGTQFCVCGKCLDPNIEKKMISTNESLDAWFTSKTDLEKLQIIKKYA